MRGRLDVTVFDSSALLAYLLGEPGADVTETHLIAGGSVSAANWSEVTQKLQHRGVWPTARDVLLSFPLHVEPVDRPLSEAAAALWQRGSGLSLADRLCLALGDRHQAEVVTADRAWAGLARVTLVR